MIRIKKLILITLVTFLLSCGNDKSNTKTSTNNEIKTSISKTQVVKKKDKTKKNTIVTIDAIIEGNEIVFDKVNPKYNNLVVLFNDFIQLKYTDMNGMIVLVHLYDSEIYNKTPNNFEKQVSTLSRSEQANVKVKSSKLSFTIPGIKPGSFHIKELYNGEVVLKEFTEERIVILFEGQGFPVGVNQGESKLFPMKGKIVIESYNTYDSRR